MDLEGTNKLSYTFQTRHKQHFILNLNYVARARVCVSVCMKFDKGNRRLHVVSKRPSHHFPYKFDTCLADGHIFNKHTN